jgi:ATP-binding cassette ChvD family protein
MSQRIVFALERLTKKHGRKVVLKDVSLCFLDNAKIGVIGLNGAGKSTLLRIMAGEDHEYEGTARAAEGITVGFVPQEPKLLEDKTVLGNVEQAVAPIRALLHRHDALNEKLAGDLDPDAMEKVLEELGAVQNEIEAKNAWSLDHQLEVAMTKLHLPPREVNVRELSGGERRRVALCRMLLAHPDILLLDEPTNHLDVETVTWLEETLASYRGTVIVVTHDRFFLDRVVGWMLEVFHGRCIPYEGNYSRFLEAKQKRTELTEKQEAARAKFLERELEWIRMNPRARTAKNKARLNNYERMLAEEVEEQEGSVDLHIPAGKRLGDTVVRFEKVGFRYGDHEVLKDITFELQPGDVLGVVGPNGTGKTTLLKLITGQLQPTAGRVVLGPTVELCYVDQERATLDPAKNVWQEVTDGLEVLQLGKHAINSRSYVAKFNFTGQDQQQLVGTLSGGQRNRVQLAKMLRRGGNLVLLDEPTNDLDLDTLRVLEEAIQNFPGCMVVVSHDRYFLDRICSRIIDLGHYEPGKYLDNL